MRLLSCLAVTSLVSAQIGNVYRAPARPEDRGQVEGTVTNGVTGEPIRKAQVALERSPGNADYGAITDGEGRFLIPNVDPGRYIPAVSRNGFVTAPNGPHLLVLGKAQTLRDFQLRLLPQGVISGRILDDDGDPVAQVVVQCMKYIYQQGRREIAPVDTQSTNDLGEYRFFGLAPGKYFILATRRGAVFSPPSPPSKDAAAEEGYQPVFYPNGNAIDEASPVHVAAGESVQGIELTLHHAHAVHVRGTVINVLSNTPLSYAPVKLSPRGMAGISAARIADVVADDKGSFEFARVIPGAYTLECAGGRRDGPAARMSLDVGNSNLDGIVVPFGLSIAMAGRVKVAEGTNGTVPPQLSIRLDPTNADLGEALTARVNEDATFSFAKLAPGAYWVTVNGRLSGYYVQAVKAGAADITNTFLDLTRGGAPGELVIVVSPGAGQVDGTVLDAQQKSAPGMQIVLIPEASKRELGSLYRYATTDANGRFNLSDVTPGEYKVFSWEQVESGAWRDPDFLKDYESRGEAVHVDPGGRATVQVSLIAGN